MSDGFNEMPVRGKHLHNAEVPDSTAVDTLPAIAGNVAPSYTEGNVVALSTDLQGNLRVALQATSGGTAPTVALDSATLTALESIDLNASTIAAITAALESVDLNQATRDDIVSRLTTAITDQTTALSANLESVTLNPDTTVAVSSVAGEVEVKNDSGNPLSVTGTVAISNSQLEITNDAGNPIPISGSVTISDGAGPVTVDGTVDLSATSLAALESIDLNATTLASLNTARTLSVRGAALSDTNPLPVNLQENPGVTADSGVLTQANVAPGATATLTGPAVGTGTGKLIEVTAHASVRIKIEVRANGSTRRVFFVDPTSPPLVYSPKDRDLIFAAAGNTFSVVITNMDNLRTADVYASLAHVEG